MAWYRFHCRSGPGRMSPHEEYRWYDYGLSEREGRDEWDDWVSRWHDLITGGVEKVETLPPEIRKQKIEQYMEAVVHAQRMLALLDVKP